MAKPLRDVGLDNYLRLWDDQQFLNSLWVTVRFVTASVAIETVLGLALALFCLREFRGIRLLRTVLIVPMVITPVVVAIVFRLIYASDAGMLTAFSEALGGGPVQILGEPTRAFIGLVALDVWEWTPLMFLILLAGLQSLAGRAVRGGAGRRRRPMAGVRGPYLADAAAGARHRHRAAHHRRLRHLRSGFRADPRRPRRGDPAALDVRL